MAEWSRTWTYLDGEWLEGNVPIIGPRTHAFWLGSSVFDGARAFEGVTPDLEQALRPRERLGEERWDWRPTSRWRRWSGWCGTA